MRAIAKITFLEVLHRKVFHLVFLLTLAFLFAYGLMLYSYYKEPITDPIMRNIISTQLLSLGLYLSNFVIAFLAILGSSGSIASEIENGVMQSILVKPIERRDIIIGKYIGLSVMLAVYSSFFYLAVVGLNLFFVKGSVAYFWGSIIKGLGFFVIIPLVIIAISLWGSTFLTTLSNGVMAVMLYSFAIVGGILEQIGWIVEKSGLINIGIISSLILPVDSLYRKMINVLLTAAPEEATIVWNGFFSGSHEPSIWMLFYTIGFIAFFVWRAISIFRRRDI